MELIQAYYKHIHYTDGNLLIRKVNKFQEKY